MSICLSVVLKINDVPASHLIMDSVHFRQSFCPDKAVHEDRLPPFDEIEGVTQPQSPQHEQQTEDGHFSRALHQRLGEED